MKQPVWVLNSSLLILFCMSQLLLFMLQKAVPRRVSISLGKAVEQEMEKVQPVDISTIYKENDLFGTYEVPVIMSQTPADDTVTPIPKPPKTILSDIPIEKAPVFFAPLDVILKGVIFVKDDPASSIAIIQIKKTKEEHNYQVGDLVEDAQILKILSNRIIIIRSNGQQETLYLREEDAVQDFNTELNSTAKGCVELSSENKYTINIDEFGKKIHNLGEFINALDLTTVYKEGKSFGCRVGKIEKDLLGAAMGFVVNDTIIKVDDYFVDDIANRIKLYDHIVSRQPGDVIEVVLYRGTDTITLMYGLMNSAIKDVEFTPQQTHQKLMEQLSKREAAALATSRPLDSPNSVIIQGVSGDDQNEKEESSAENFDSELYVEDVMIHSDQQDQLFQLNQVQDLQDDTSATIVPIVYQQTLNESDAHRRRLLQEREKMSLVSEDMKSKDRKNMLKQGSRNVIFNGMK